jgi:superfamily II DNA or RNA helicase
MITSVGYRVPLNDENKVHINRCVMYSQIKSDFPGPPSKVVCYRKSNEYIYLPRYYGYQEFGKQDYNYKYTPISVTFKGQMRDYQKEIINETIEKLKETDGGVWSISVGMGKTIMALYLLSLLKMKTIIIVHKQVLLDQWKDRIQEFLPDAKVGLIQGPIVSVEDKDIILSMIQTLTRKDHNREIFKDIGLTIIDEVHNVCSKTFSRVLFKIQTKYRLGLSATPKRRDGFDKVIEYHIGPIIIEKHEDRIVPLVEVYESNESDVKVEFNKAGKVNIPKLLTDLSSCDKRNSLITKIILKLIKQNRKIIVFSDRVAQCKRLDEFFKENCNWKISDTFIGEKKKDQLEIAKKADVMFATYGICKEGFDHPELDTLIFATPKSNITQAVGRILRKENKNRALIIDIKDNNVEMLKIQFFVRRRWYLSKNYNIDYR